MSTDSITIFCLVIGDEPASQRAFPVDICRNDTVGHLKDAIKTKKQPLFDHVVADQLVLWKVNVPVNNNACQFNQHGGIRLNALDDIGDVFIEKPAKKHIHVLIEQPSLGKHALILDSFAGHFTM